MYCVYNEFYKLKYKNLNCFIYVCPYTNQNKIKELMSCLPHNFKYFILSVDNQYKMLNTLSPKKITVENRYEINIGIFLRNKSKLKEKEWDNMLNFFVMKRKIGIYIVQNDICTYNSTKRKY